MLEGGTLLGGDVRKGDGRRGDFRRGDASRGDFWRVLLGGGIMAADTVVKARARTSLSCMLFANIEHCRDLFD